MIDAARVLLDVMIAGLWQAALISLAAVCLLRACRRSLNAATRCVILQAALLAMLVVPVVTTIPRAGAAPVQISAQALQAGEAQNAMPVGSAWSVPRRIDIALDDRIVLGLGAAWVLGVLLFAGGIALGALQVMRLLRRSALVAYRDGVRIFVSKDVDVPVAAGVFSSAIVLPGDLAAEDSEELECVIAHELAHVLRGDVVMNAVEHLIRALLYFNPFVWWTVRAIALEREVACDDRAVYAGLDVDSYTRNLAVLALRRHATRTAGTCGAVGFANLLVRRIDRLRDARRNASTRLSRFPFGGTLCMFVLLALGLQMLAPAVALTAQSQPAAAPAATQMPVKPNCRQDAYAIDDGPPPSNLPANLSGSVKVRIAPSGKAMSATIATTSGNRAFDDALIKLAEQRTYAPAIRNCKPVVGTYVFKLSTRQP